MQDTIIQIYIEVANCPSCHTDGVYSYMFGATNR